MNYISSSAGKTPSKNDIINANEIISRFAHNTDVITSAYFNRLLNSILYFKSENFQKTGSFKIRGAINAVCSLTESQKKNGVVTHSSGNFGQALAYAAKLNNIKSYIVTPQNASKVKSEAAISYGAEIIHCEPTLESRETTAKKVMQKTSAVFIHPYDDYKIIAGQASAALELINKVPGLDIIIAPVGGGGLISGTILTKNYFDKKIKVIAAEPKNADDAKQSWLSKSFIPSDNPDTICDGLKTSLGEKTFPIIMNNIDNILTASEESVIEMMKLVWERMKIIIEPSSAVAIAAIFENKQYFRNKKTGIILSGGNVDITKLPWQLEC